jgi:hypothetical protein
VHTPCSFEFYISKQSSSSPVGVSVRLLLLLLFAGHTSVDPLALLGANKPSPPVSKKAHPGATPQQLEHPRQSKSRPLDSQAASRQQGTGSVAAAVQPLSMLHVRGKSGLKHTKQLLDCWLQHPEWPQLTVIGPMPNEQITGTEAKRYMAAPNIHVPQPGKQQGECILTSHLVHAAHWHAGKTCLPDPVGACTHCLFNRWLGPGGFWQLLCSLLLQLTGMLGPVLASVVCLVGMQQSSAQSAVRVDGTVHASCPHLE